MGARSAGGQDELRACSASLEHQRSVPVEAHAAATPKPTEDWVSKYVEFVKSYRVTVVLASVVVLLVGVVSFGRVSQNLKLQARTRRLRHALVAAQLRPAPLHCARGAQVDPVRGDPNDLAAVALRHAFPYAARTQTLSVLLRSTSGNVSTSAAARDAAARLAAVAAPYVADGVLWPNSGASVFTYTDAGMFASAAATVSPDGRATELRFYTACGAAVAKPFRALLNDMRLALADAVRDSQGALTGDITGNLVINADSADANAEETSRSDGITVTLSGVMLAVALRSLRLVLLTVAALALAFGGAFICTWPITVAMHTPTFVISLMTSTLVSLSLDYSLFLLTQFKASLARGSTVPSAVEAMLRSGGHSVLVSGATLAACFLVLAIFPVSIVRAPGIATTFVVVCSVVANLLLTPVLLLLFPGFFAGEPLCGTLSCIKPLSVAPMPVSAPVWASDAPALSGFGRSAKPPASDDRVARAWARLADVTMRYKYSCTCVVLVLLVAPFAYRLPHFHVSLAVENVVPRGTPSVETFLELQRTYGPGSTAFVRLLGVATSPQANAALSPAFFASAAAAVQVVLGASSPAQLTALDVGGLAWSNGAPANYTATLAALAATAACPASNVSSCRAVCPATACAFRLQAASTLALDGRAMILRLGLLVDRAASEGIAWVTAVHAALRAFNAADSTAAWHLLVDPTPDSVSYMYDRFGMLVGITAAVVFAILLVAFRSVAIAFRAVVTLAAMEICVFGAATAIYCQGVLSLGGVLQTFSANTGLFWLMPILAFSLTTGLGLDYDVFIITSIVEERLAGWSDDDAVAVGLQRSGPVISWAGAIMAVAYGGFLFSSIPLLNQLGTFIVFAVLVDTFVVRPLLVPSMMAILGRVNYWPRAMPPVTRTLSSPRSSSVLGGVFAGSDVPLGP